MTTIIRELTRRGWIEKDFQKIDAVYTKGIGWVLKGDWKGTATITRLCEALPAGSTLTIDGRTWTMTYDETEMATLFSEKKKIRLNDSVKIKSFIRDYRNTVCRQSSD